MSDTQSGYEITLKLWVPADPRSRAEMRKATDVVDALEALAFESVVEIDGAVIRKIEARSRFVTRRASS